MPKRWHTIFASGTDKQENLTVKYEDGGRNRAIKVEGERDEKEA